MKVTISLCMLAGLTFFTGCPGPIDKDKCMTQADCLNGYTCTEGVCTQVVASDAGTGVNGTWNLVVTAAANGNRAIRSYHTMSAVEESDGGITFSSSFCNLYASKVNGLVVLKDGQSCKVPSGTPLVLDQEATTGVGDFGARNNLSAPFCYTVWLSTSTATQSSTNSYRFTGQGGVIPSLSASTPCAEAPTDGQNNASLQFDLSR